MNLASFRRQHPAFVAIAGIIIVALLAADGWVMARRTRYVSEITRLHAGMSEFERRKADAILASQAHRVDMMVQLLRRQARLDKGLHLAVSLDSARMYLERDGALLREIPVDLGPGARVGTPPDTVQLAPPRGARSVARLLGPDTGWEVPRWVYRDRRIPVPADRMVQGALGPAAIVLDGGTIIYSLPVVGPLNDPAYVLPGAVRVRAADLEAILPDLHPGMTVYFY